MKSVCVRLICVVFFAFSLQSAFGQRFWIAAAPGNWGDPNNWSTTATGPGGAGVPTAADVVNFTGSRLGACLVNVNPGTIGGFIITAGYTSAINLNGFTLTASGTSTLTGGTINGVASTLTFNSTATTTFAGTVFNVPINGTTGRLFFNGGTYNNSVDLIKTANNDDDGVGNNTFASTLSLQNNSANRLRMANTTRDIFNGTVTMTVNSTGTFELAHGSAVATQFNDNIIINYVNNAAARIGNGVGISTLAATKTITVNPGGAGAGSLTLGGMNILSPQTIALTGNTAAQMAIKTGTTFTGPTSLTAPSFSLSASTFNGGLTIEKTGPAQDDLNGGNTYTGAVNIINSSAGQFNFAANIADTFNGNVQINNTGTGRIQLGIDSPGNVINGSLTVNHGGSTAGINCILARNVNATLTINGDVSLNEMNADVSSGIIVGNDGDVTINGNLSLSSTNGRGILFANASIDASVTIGSGFSITAAAGSFTTGDLTMSRITQLGTANQSLNLTGTSVLRLNDNTFNGPVNFRAPQILLGATTFNNSAIIEKTGAGDNDGAGGAAFAGPTTITNSGSGRLNTSGNNIFNGTTIVQCTGSDYIDLEGTVGSSYNGPVQFNNSGSSNIRVARTGNTLFNDNIVVNSTSTGQILFCETTAATSATLAATKTITTTGFSAGELRLQRFTQTGATAQALTFVFPGTGLLRLGPTTTFGGNVTFSAPRVLLNGVTVNGTASIQKTGGTADDGTGGNVFMGATTIANSGSLYLLTGSTNPDTFNGVLTVNNSGSSTIRFSDASAGNIFANNIVLNTSSGTGIYFGNGGGSSTLANDRTITAGSVLTGDVRLLRMVQTSSVNPQVLDLNGIAILTIGPGSQFGGDVDFRAPQVYLNGCIYGTTAANVIRLEKESATENIGAGGNVFNGVTSIINSGSNSFRSANTAPDIFNANLTISVTGTGAVTPSYTVAGNQYNGNIQFNCVLGGAGISLGGNGGASTLSPTAVLSIGPSGYVSGDLRLARVTQTGSLMQTLLLTPPAAGVARLRLGPATSFGGPIDFRAPRILLEGATFNDVTYIEKTGATDDTSAGGNVFNGSSTTIANSGTGWFINADLALDQFNNDLTVTNTGSAGIRMADNIPGTVFRGNILVNSTFGLGIYFCETSAAATATLSATKVITVGGLGFTTGDLRLRRFTQLSATPQAMTITGVGRLILGPTVTFNGDVNFRAPQLAINTGSVYNGTATLEKTGATDNTGSGGTTFNSTTSIKSSGSGYLRTNGSNVFNGTTTLTNSGTNDMLLELLAGSTYNGDVEMINNGTSQIRAGYIGTTAFNGNLLVNCTSGTGIFFGENATAINLANTKTIAVGATGFTASELRLQRFNQLGTGTPQNLVLTGSALVRFQSNTTFNSALTTSSPRVLFDGGIFNGAGNFTKTGTVTDDSNGANTFNAATVFTNNGTGRLRLAGTLADTYNGNMTFVRGNTGALEPAYAGTNTFTGDVTTNSGTALVFGAGTGIQTFSGTNAQSISKIAGASPQLNRIVVNKGSNGITLNTDIVIGNSATFTSGIITTTGTNIINFANGATVAGASNTSHVSGPVRKTGTDAFVFPVGKNGLYKSIAVGARAVAGDQFTAEYFNTVQTSGATLGPGLNAVSGCEYWTLARTTGTATPTVTLSWKNSDCPNVYVVNTTDLRVAVYNTGASRWEDRGNGGVTGVGGGLPGEGTIVSSAAVTVFGAFALGTSTSVNPLPIELVDFTASNMGTFVALNWQTATEVNNDYFTIQRSNDGAEFFELATVKGAGTSKRDINYSYNDANPREGISYYRLKQTDFDGKTSYSKVVKINRNEEATLMVYPNPMVGTTAFTNIRGTFTIYNSVGQAVLAKSDTNEMDVSALGAGVYVVRSSTGQSFRLVIK